MTEARVEPIRMFMDNPDTTWRYGKPPNYALANKLYFKGRTTNHKEGSLEKKVEDLVKTWEMEATHKIIPKDWKSVDAEKYTLVMNNTRKWNIQESIEKGTYNTLLMDSPVYDAVNSDFQSSHALFKKTFTEGFAWELLEIMSGPPNVTFTWRHWSNWTGPYKEQQPTGELLEFYGVCIARVNGDLQIEQLEVFCDPNPLVAKLAGIKQSSCPFAKQ